MCAPSALPPLLLLLAAVVLPPPARWRARFQCGKARAQLLVLESRCLCVQLSLQVAARVSNGCARCFAMRDIINAPLK